MALLDLVSWVYHARIRSVATNAHWDSG